MIIKSIALPKIKPKIVFEKMDQTVSEAIKNGEEKREAQAFKGNEGKFIEFKSPLPFVYIFLVFGTLLLLGVIFIQRFVRAEFTNLRDAILTLNQTGSISSREALNTPSQKNVTPIQSSRAKTELLNSVDAENIRKLGPQSLLALVSDCYWCGENGYASWLWNQMIPDQKVALLSEIPWIGSYISSLPSEVEIKNYHQHPYYLMPQQLSEVSQENIQAWLKENPGAWHYISPMRQNHMALSLFQKVEMAYLSRPKEVPFLPKPSATVKSFAPKLDISEITFADELEILEDHSKIPVQLRGQIHSLVWIALLKIQDQVEIFSQLSAQQLAQAWIGPEEILSRLAVAVGEKKMKLLMDYLPQVNVSRTSMGMQYLVQEALKVLAKSEDEKRSLEEKKSAA